MCKIDAVLPDKPVIVISLKFGNSARLFRVRWWAENVRKEESSGGLSVSTPKVDFKNETDFDNSIVGKATRAAIEEIAKLIDQKMGNVPWEGKIIKVTGTTVFMKPGSDSGVKVFKRRITG